MIHSSRPSPASTPTNTECPGGINTTPNFQIHVSLHRHKKEYLNQYMGGRAVLHRVQVRIRWAGRVGVAGSADAAAVGSGSHCRRFPVVVELCRCRAFASPNGTSNCSSVAFHAGWPGGSSLYLTSDVAAPPDQDLRPGECLAQCRWFLVFWVEVLFL